MKSNVFATSPQGYSVHFELEGEKVYKDTLLLCEQIQKDGFTARSRDANTNGDSSHWCQEHQIGFKRMEKDGQVWYSHKKPDGKWCKEK